MHRSPPRFRQRALVAALITLCSAQARLPAAAQDSVPPAQLAPAEPATTSAPTSVPMPAPASSPTAAPASIAEAVPSPADQVRLQELARLYALRDRQRAGSRNWQVPLIGLALGTVTLLTGAMLYVDSMSNLGDLPCDEENQPCGYNDRKLYAGLALMMIGPSLILVSAPMLIVRSTRDSRIRATETAIRRLGGQLSLAPTLSPRGEVGLRLHARF